MVYVFKNNAKRESLLTSHIYNVLNLHQIKHILNLGCNIKIKTISIMTLFNSVLYEPTNLIELLCCYFQ